jgi:hypothetical protein
VGVNKWLVIGLVLVVLLFLGAIVLGASHGSGRPDRPDGVSHLQGLQGNRFLAFGDHASAPCAAPGSTFFTFSSTCTITVDKRGFFSKSTRVALIPQQTVTVVTDTSVPTQTVTVDSGKCFATAIDHSGGTVTMTGGINTQVAVGPTPDCPQKPGEG